VLGCLVLVYAVVLGLSPALHHDIDCHLKSPTHCSACLASPAASGAQGAQDLAAGGRPTTGRIERFRASWPVPPGRAPLTGRGPPA
jgi:hypothetical protein